MSMGNNSRSSLDSKPPLMGLSHDDWDKFVVIAFCCTFVVIAFYSFVVIAFCCNSIFVWSHYHTTGYFYSQRRKDTSTIKRSDEHDHSQVIKFSMPPGMIH